MQCVLRNMDTLKRIICYCLKRTCARFRIAFSANARIFFLPYHEPHQTRLLLLLHARRLQPGETSRITQDT
jgi:hypothetical protein